MKNISITDLNKNEMEDVFGGLGWLQTAVCTAFCAASATVSLTGPIGFSICMGLCLTGQKVVIDKKF